MSVAAAPAASIFSQPSPHIGTTGHYVFERAFVEK